MGVVTPLEKDPEKGLNGAIAAELRAERSAQRITFDALADLTKISKRTLLRVFGGERHITSAYLETICEELGLPMSVIVKRAERRLDHVDTPGVIPFPAQMAAKRAEEGPLEGQEESQESP